MGPRTGYDIRQMMAVSTGFFWNESFGQIYPILGQLNKDGLIEALQAEVVGRRARQQYRITEAGLQRLDAWLREPVQHSPIRNELLLKLFFGASIDIAVAVGHLEQRRERAHDTLRAYENARTNMKASRRADPAHRVYYEATLNYGVAIETAILSWIEATLVALGQQTGVAKAG